MNLIKDILELKGARRLGLPGYARGKLSCCMYYKLLVTDKVYEIN